MEGANEGGRQAANGVLDAAGSTAARVALTGLHVPQELASFKRIDRDRYRRGLPHVFDTDAADVGRR